jgi:hypothetical protein
MTEQLSSNSNEPVPINQSISGNTGQAQQIYAALGSVTAYQDNTVNYNYYHPESDKVSYSSSFLIEDANHYTRIVQKLNLASNPLLNWPKTVNGNQEINRPELNYLLSQIKDNTSSTTVILGNPGSGKSALMAKLGYYLQAENYSFLGIKADLLGQTVESLDQLRHDPCVNLSANPINVIREIAKEETVVLIVDQLDALSELLDRRPGRLNVLLTLISSLHDTDNVHIVATCREFEFQYSTQFRQLDSMETLRLELPPWSNIAPILETAGHDPASYSDSMQELLRSPINIKVFLEVAKPGELFNSSQNLLERLWEKWVQEQEQRKLLERLAQRMKEEESLWLPLSETDDCIETRKSLERAGILTRHSTEQLKIGFQHQTYYDFTLARAFARQNQILTDYVLEYQDGLFVRPSFLRSLHYIRATNSKSYRKQLKILLKQAEPNCSFLKNWISRWVLNILRSDRVSPEFRRRAITFFRTIGLLSVRKHIYELLVEFVGGQSNPNSDEVQLFASLLDNDQEGKRLLKATVASSGWFNHLYKSRNLGKWLQKSPQETAYTIGLLVTATQFAEDKVWHLLSNYWLCNSSYDTHTIRVLQQCQQWDVTRVKQAAQVVYRCSEISWDEASYLAESILEKCPQATPLIIRAYLNKHVEQLAERESGSNGALELLRMENHYYNLTEFAERVPKPFLEEIWPLFLSCLQQSSVGIDSYENPYQTGYHRDHLISLEGHTGDIVEALKFAVIGVAEHNQHDFMQFVKDNKTYELLPVHCLLARGLEKIAAYHPQFVLNYLLEDARRLSLGDSWDKHRESKKLITAVCPYLDSQQLSNLEQAVLAYDYLFPAPANMPPDYRFRRMQYKRQNRLRLLRAFPENCLSSTTKKLKQEEERVFSETIEQDLFTGMQYVGSRMTVDEMMLASDEQLLNLCNELSDETAWSNPREPLCNDISRAGGVIQAAREFGKLAKRDPQRMINFLPRLQAQCHETYVGIIIRDLVSEEGKKALTSINYPLSQLISLIENFDQRGFQSEQFRDDTAYALEELAKVERGLPNRTLSMLEHWLAEYPEPDLSNNKDEANSAEKHQNSPILFVNEITRARSSSRSFFVSAIALGYLLQQPPDYKNWARVVEDCLEQEKHLSVWDFIISQMPYLLNWNCEQATQLFDRTLQVCPAIFYSQWSLCFIFWNIRLYQPKTVVQRWIERLLKENSFFCLQAYGEALLLYDFHCGDAWSKSHIESSLTDFNNEAILLGLAYGATELWHDSNYRSTATEILIRLSSHPAQSIQQAIAQLFGKLLFNSEDFELNEHIQKLLDALCSYPSVLLQASRDLIELIYPFTENNPEIVYKVCHSLLNYAQPNDFSLAPVAEFLTEIAINIHRQKGFRRQGLEMVEKLVELNLNETRAALETLDRKPNRSHIPIPRRRRFTKRRRAT